MAAMLLIVCQINSQKAKAKLMCHQIQDENLSKSV